MSIKYLQDALASLEEAHIATIDSGQRQTIASMILRIQRLLQAYGVFVGTNVTAADSAEKAGDKDYLNIAAKLVEDRLPDAHGFILFVFPFGNAVGRRLSYCSNAARKDAVFALKEWLIQASGEEEWMKNIK